MKHRKKVVGSPALSACEESGSFRLWQAENGKRAIKDNCDKKGKHSRKQEVKKASTQENSQSRKQELRKQALRKQELRKQALRKQALKTSKQGRSKKNLAAKPDRLK
jgi:hypothetical protein